MWNKNERVPSFGYILYGRPCYRATAVAIMEREGMKIVTHQNGKNYFLPDLKKAMIN
jgi:hypothetical protein